MVSSAEQLAANLKWNSFSKSSELKSRIFFTIFVLIIYRIGTHIPLPGINPVALSEFAQQTQSGILGVINLFSGGAIQRMAIFALGIMPYISASIIIQLLTAIIPSLEQLKKEGESGRNKITQYTRFGTVALAIFQAYGISIGLLSQEEFVLDPGISFQISTVITLVGGTIFLMWLGEQITARGIGNGISLLIFAGIVAELPTVIAQFFELGRAGQISSFVIVFVILMFLALISFIVYMERAQRKLLVQYPKRQVGRKVYGGESSHLPVKVNASGVIPPIFASSILLLPVTVASFSSNNLNDGVSGILSLFGRGQPLFLISFAVLIIFFCFFYTSIVFNPKDVAENLKKNGGFIPGIRPGAKTADYLDFVLTRLTVIGAAYLVFICLVPEILTARSQVPFYFGGTSLLIIVSVTLDTISQVQSYIFAHQYEDLIEKSKLRGKRR